MQPLRIRVERIIDFCTVVSFVGVDTGTQQQVTVHVDHRPFEMLLPASCDSWFPETIEYEAERLTLRLDMVADDDAEAVCDD